MIKTERIFYFLVIIACIITVWQVFSRQDNSYADEYRNQVDLLNNKIDSLNNVNIFLEEELDSLTSKISFLDLEINKQDQLLEELNEETNERLNSVDTLSANNTAKFFADRYRDRRHSSTSGDSSSSN